MFSVHTLTIVKLILQVNSTVFHASKLVNNAGEVNRIEFRFLYSAVLNWLIDARSYAKINFRLVNNVLQDAIEINGYI